MSEIIFLTYSPEEFLPDGTPIPFASDLTYLLRKVCYHVDQGIYPEFVCFWPHTPRKKEIDPEVQAIRVEVFTRQEKPIILCGAEVAKLFLGKEWSRYVGTGVKMGNTRVYPVEAPTGITSGAEPGNLYLAVRKAHTGVVVEEQ